MLKLQYLKMTNRQHYGLYDDNDNQETIIKKLINFKPFKNFKKNSSGSDNEKNYIDESNKKFKAWSKSKKQKHVLGLWRRAYYKALGVVHVINLNEWMQSKLKLFGGHMLNYQKVRIYSERD